MSPELINGLVQGGASAVLLGAVLLILMPKILRGIEKTSKRFSIEMHAERDSHRAEVQMIAAELAGIRKATDGQTLQLKLELQRQTLLLEHVGRQLSDDLPDVRALLKTNPGIVMRVERNDLEVLDAEVEEEP